MNITDRLQELDPTLIRHNEGAWDKSFDPAAEGYSSFNDAGVEIEVGEFLYAMVRMLKPERVLETGTHIGVGAAYMGMALKDNNSGTMTTVEFLPEIHARAVERMKQLGLQDIVYCKYLDVRALIPERNYQFILLDTEPQTRFEELIKFEPSLAPGGFIFIHDLHRHMGQTGVNPDHPNDKFWPWGEIPETMKKLVQDDKLRPFHFANPRGLTGFYKPSKEDYNWE